MTPYEKAALEAISKRMVAGPDRIDALEKRVAALERFMGVEKK